jgi:hypothetical protein
MNLCFMAYAALAFYFQADVFLAAATQRLSIGAFLAAQAYLLAANLTLATFFRMRPDARGALLQLALWSAIAGPFGTLVCLGLGAFRWPTAKSGFASWLQGQVEPAHKKRLQILRSALRYDRLRIEGASAAPPLNDIFLEGSQEEKLDALNAIGRRYEPALATALRFASKDADAAVRVLAATVTAKLQAAASKSVAASEATARLSNAPQAWISAAEDRLRYEASGLLGAAQRQSELKAALAAIEEALSLAPTSRAAAPELHAECRGLAQALDALDPRDARERVNGFIAAARLEMARERNAASPDEEAIYGAALS